MKRRAFLKKAGAAAALLSCFPADLTGMERELKPEQLERRALGKTGRKLSIIGFGGLVLKGTTPERAAELVRLAYESGVNYFDVAPSYGDAEQRLGPALEPFRKYVFLACKTGRRDAKGAAEELDRSLEHLRTDHFDLYQLHAVTSTKDVESIFADNGAIHAFEEAKKRGKVRLLGFSAHSVEAAMALMDRFSFDTILFPVNYATWYAGNFGPQVLARAKEKQMGILAIKSMAKCPWPKGADRSAHPNCWYEPMTDPQEALMGLRFTLSHPVTAAVHPADQQCMKIALEVAPRFRPLEPADVKKIKEAAAAQEPLFRYRG